MSSAHNIDYKQFHNDTKHKLILNKQTLTETLTCQDRIIYEAPICTCLSCFLNDDMEKMQKLTQKSIHNNIAAILSHFGVTFEANEHMHEKRNVFNVNDKIKLRFLDLTRDELVQSIDPAHPNSYDNMNKLHEVSDITFDLLHFERMFYYDTYFDDSSFTPQRDVLRNMLIEYIANLKSDPICKELQFFYYVFNNGEYYTFSENDAIDFCSLESVFARKTFDYLRRNYIAIRHTRQCYDVRDYQDICVLTLLFAVQNGLTISQCQNCRQYFITRNRSDEKYCDNPSPQNSNKTCKQYEKTTGSYQRNQADKILHKCKNILSASERNAKRHPEIASNQTKYEKLKQEVAKRKKQYKSGTLSAEEFDAWLDEQKARKT